MNADSSLAACDDGDFLIGQEGRDQLVSSLAAVLPQDVPEFLHKFRQAHSVRRAGIDPVLAFLEMGGVSRNTVHTTILKSVISEAVRLIQAAASRGDAERIAMMFQPTFRFLTVNPLREVAIAVLETVDEQLVGSEHWHQVVDEGLDTEPYCNLPGSLKRRIWQVSRKAFEYEIERVLGTIGEYTFPVTMETLMSVQQIEQDSQAHAATKSLVELVIHVGELQVHLLTILVECMLEAAKGTECTENQRIALGNVLLLLMSHELIAPCLGIGSSNKSQLERLSFAATLILQQTKLETVKRLPQHQLQLFKSWVGRSRVGPFVQGEGEELKVRSENESIVEAMGLLFYSTYTRDVFANQVTSILYSISQGDPATVNDENGVYEALQSDRWLQDTTYLALSAIQAKQLLLRRESVSDSVSHGLMTNFYPTLLREMALDYHWRDRLQEVCVRLPAVGLRMAMEDGCLQRRIMSIYGYTLFEGNFRMCYMRHRMVFDAIVRFSMADPAEMKEVVIAQSLIEASVAEDL